MGGNNVLILGEARYPLPLQQRTVYRHFVRVREDGNCYEVGHGAMLSMIVEQAFTDRAMRLGCSGMDTEVQRAPEPRVASPARGILALAPMKKIFHKLLMGKGHPEGQEFLSTVRKRKENIKAIWNNEYEEDAGLEKLLRLVLSCSQFLFPGMYVKHLFWKKGPLYQDLATEVFVLLKTALPLWMLYTGRENDPWLFALMIWLLLETVVYIPTLIFASDTFATPRSYRRGTLLLFLNYLEVVLSFAVIYAAGHHLNQPVTHWSEAVYFSFVTSSTIGFGDYFPVTKTGRMLVVLQSLFYLSYIVLFINFFSLRRKRGYFRDDDGAASG